MDSVCAPPPDPTRPISCQLVCNVETCVSLFTWNGRRHVNIPCVSVGQPTARSTPVHHSPPCRTQPGGQLRNGAKPHPHTHCPHPTPPTQANGDRKGSPHPKLGSLPRGGSSTSSSSSAGPRSTKKLQSNPSITSQSSKRSKSSSKSSSKSNSSQIPTEAQDGKKRGVRWVRWGLRGLWGPRHARPRLLSRFLSLISEWNHLRGTGTVM